MAGYINIKKILGNNIRIARKKRNMVQEKLAEMVGIEPPALSKIENGKSYPTAETLEKIIQVLDIEPQLLYLSECNFDLEEAYQDMLVRLEKLKTNRADFKQAYDFVVELTKNI